MKSSVVLGPILLTLFLMALTVVWLIGSAENKRLTPESIEVLPTIDATVDTRSHADPVSAGVLHSDQYAGGMNTYLSAVDDHVSGEYFAEQSGFSVYGKQCDTVRNQTLGDRYECSSVFFNASNTVHLYAPTNGGFLNENRILAFPDADPATFHFLRSFSGFDAESLHYAAYLRDPEDSNNSHYVATSTPITTVEYELLQLLVERGADDMAVKWLRQPAALQGELTVRSSSDTLRSTLRKNFVEVSDENGPLLYMAADSAHARSIKVLGNDVLYFDREGLYVLEIGSEPQLLLDIDSRYMYHISGSDHVYYLEDYSAPNIFQFHIPTRTTRRVGVDDDRSFVRSLNIFVSTDEQRVYTRASWNTSTSTGYFPQESALLEIDIATGAILSEIPYEQPKHGSLFPFAVSPNGQYVYNIPVPYEGYMFDEMQYYQRDSAGGWTASSTVFTDFRLEVGGGWNARTGQWLLSPDQSLVVTSDASELHTVPCMGMGDAPSVQNQLKVLILDEREAVIVKELGPWQEFSVSHWDAVGQGVYYYVSSFEPGTCNKTTDPQLQYQAL